MAAVQKKLAAQLFHSLREKLFAVGDEIEIYPAHGSGSPCGGHIKSAQHAFAPEVAEYSQQLDKQKPLAVYCGSGYRASIAAGVLQARGFKNVMNVPGSMKAWQSAGFDLEK